MAEKKKGSFGRKFATVVGVLLAGLAAKQLTNIKLDRTYHPEIADFYKYNGVNLDGDRLKDAAKIGLKLGLTPDEIKKIVELGKAPDTQLSVSDVITKYPNPASDAHLGRLSANPYFKSQIDYRTEQHMRRAREIISSDPVLRQKLTGQYKWDVTVPYVKFFARKIHNMKQIEMIARQKPASKPEPFGKYNQNNLHPSMENRSIEMDSSNVNSKVKPNPADSSRDNYDKRRKNRV